MDFQALTAQSYLIPAREDPLCPSFDILKLGLDDSEEWMGNVESYDVALFDVELAAAKSPGKYAILNRQTGQREVLNFELLPGRDPGSKNPDDYALVVSFVS